MKNVSKKITIILIATMYLFAGCNKESYIESIGHVMLESGDETEIGYFIFTSVKAASTCGKLSIYIDDKLVGQLTTDFSGNINCETEPIEGKIVKVVAGTGSHKIVVKYNDGCKKDATTTYTLQKGKCMWYYIS